MHRRSVDYTIEEEHISTVGFVRFKSTQASESPEIRVVWAGIHLRRGQGPWNMNLLYCIVCTQCISSIYCSMAFVFVCVWRAQSTSIVLAELLRQGVPILWRLPWYQRACARPQQPE